MSASSLALPGTMKVTVTGSAAPWPIGRKAQPPAGKPDRLRLLFRRASASRRCLAILLIQLALESDGATALSGSDLGLRRRGTADSKAYDLVS